MDLIEGKVTETLEEMGEGVVVVKKGYQEFV